jgi:hypothetical protein
MIEVASRQAPAATLVQGDAVPLPFADGAFERLHTATSPGTCGPRSAPRSSPRRAAWRASS